MTCIINASTTNNLQISSDGSGIVKVQSNGVTTNALAWVRFNGVTTVTIASSYNVSSVVRNATGDYTINYSNALSDANYSMVSSGNRSSAFLTALNDSRGAPTTSLVNIATTNLAGILSDSPYASVAIFGN